MELDQCACSGKTLDRLLRPAVLALLAREKTHGYEIIQQLHQLAMYADAPPDTSGVYKVLKSMEEEGFVSADWEFSGTGPARRSYTLTKDGIACLKRWTETLSIYRAKIDALLTVLDQSCKLPVNCNARKCRCLKR